MARPHLTTQAEAQPRRPAPCGSNRRHAFRSCCLIFCCGLLAGRLGRAEETPLQNPSRHGSDESASAAGAMLLQGRLVDLTHPFDQRTIYWPTEQGFQLVPGPAGITEQGYFYAANRFQAAEHGGTHIDAPIHFFKGGQTVDQIPLERLVGEAAVIDVVDQCATDPDYQIGVGDLRRWEERQGRQLVDLIVLLRTGYGRYWSDRHRYLGTAETGPLAATRLRFPGLEPEAARWLVEHRAVKAIGIDTASIDYGRSQRFASHVALFAHQVPVFENVARLDRLPPAGSSVIALPMKIAGGTGAPLRIIALLPE